MKFTYPPLNDASLKQEFVWLLYLVPPGSARGLAVLCRPGEGNLKPLIGLMRLLLKDCCLTFRVPAKGDLHYART